MKRRRAWNGRINRQRVTLEAHRIYLTASEQARIGRAVGNVASDTALDLHSLVFEDKGASLIGVTSEANRVLGSRRTQLRRQEAAMLVMAIATFHQAFIDAMVKGLAELRTDVLMTSIAEPGLAIDEEKLRLFGMMR